MTRLKRYLLLAHFIFTLFFISFKLSAEITVRISMSPFEPFVLDTDPPSGIAIDMMELMNNFQDTYHFTFIMTTSVRRHKAFKNGLFEMSMFDNYKWGWEGFPVDVSKVYLKGGEIYVALAKPDRTQSYFKEFEQKRMIGMLGYHYGFADFNSDQSFLKERFHMSLTTNNLATITMLLKDRGDIAVITESFFNQYLKNNQHMRNKFIRSNHYDQEYNHTIIIRKGIKPSIEEINTLLEDMEKAGILEPLWESIGLQSVLK
ncbi:transporter substrate-binding domain-containing protein [Zooshikella ganghwensis]|uniref:Amino acid ABC transporter substrate-binding protein n=1 Tax=Zooshikella ganghwensis TaxID=202772 RepID=A0A4P9VMQ0_9GAMM|nr:transporter substrate-binding domain-containing protein [Zooshikella ganghwensis]RDH44166.1 amino acid ABC transporter substrate-binding protein [Zooshikella ganghwensis]